MDFIRRRDSDSTTACRERERGFVIVLAASAVVLFTMLAGLAIGIGIISSVRLTSQNAANAAALAALEAWVVAPGIPNADRAEASREGAERVLSQINLPGFFATPGNLFGSLRFPWETEDDDTGGVLSLGRFYPSNPDSSGAGPCTSYPCFVSYPALSDAQLGSSQAVVNAVQLSLKTPNSNPIIAPFTRIFGSEAFQVSVVSTATLVQRCTAFLVDLSGSSFIETHAPMVDQAPASPPFPARFSFTVRDSAAFALNSQFITSGGALRALTSIDCNAAGGPSGINVADLGSLAWCNMRPSRAALPAVGRPWDNQIIPYTDPVERWPIAPPHPANLSSSEIPAYRRIHYRDDFRANPSAFFGGQNFLVDEYVDEYYSGPEPFTSYMQGFNAALRTLQTQQTALDRVMLKGFIGRPLNSIPPFLEGPLGEPLTSDLGYMIQITNLENRGTFTRSPAGVMLQVTQEIRPNFIDHGFFSVPSSEVENQSTNLVEILDETIEQLSLNCPANAKKQIILATDGVVTCDFVTHSGAAERAVGDPSLRRNCIAPEDVADYQTYLQAERQLIGEEGYVIPDNNFVGRPQLSSGVEYPSIVERLIDEQIAVTVLLAGSYVGPNFWNLTDADSAEAVSRWVEGSEVEGSPVSFLPYSKALGFGFTGLNPSSQFDYVDYQSTPAIGASPDGEAYRNVGRPGYVFRRPNGTLSRLAMRSGGLWCPLMQPASGEGCYPDGQNLSVGCRSQPQTTSAINVPTSILAAQCSSAAVGHNPYMLSEPFEVCENDGPAANPRCPLSP